MYRADTTPKELEQHLRAAQRENRRLRIYACGGLLMLAGAALLVGAEMDDRLASLRRHVAYHEQRQMELEWALNDALAGWDEAIWQATECAEALDLCVALK